VALTRWVGRAIGLDVHRDFCVVAICEDGEVRTAGRVPGTPEGLRMLADSLVESDRVALEVTGSCWEVARILGPHVDRVVVVSPDDTGIVHARAKTDRLDARTLARLLWSGELESVWMPDERCRVLRRRLARREQLVHARSRAKNEIQAVLQRRLQGKPACSDLFGVKGRQWLATLELPGRGARVRRRRDPPDRVPGHRDRGGRALDRPAGARVAGDPPLDDRSRCEPDLRVDVHGCRRRSAPVLQ
jgi:transposase